MYYSYTYFHISAYTPVAFSDGATKGWGGFAAGLDVLDVVKRMREFAATYCYSLPSQLFIERAGAAAGARQLNTLTPPDVNAALKSHGAPLADVAATRAAVFLSQRLLILSQVRFLECLRYDHIVFFTSPSPAATGGKAGIAKSGYDSHEGVATQKAAKGGIFVQVKRKRVVVLSSGGAYLVCAAVGCLSRLILAKSLVAFE